MGITIGAGHGAARSSSRPEQPWRAPEAFALRQFPIIPFEMTTRARPATGFPRTLMRSGYAPRLNLPLFQRHVVSPIDRQLQQRARQALVKRHDGKQVDSSKQMVDFDQG